MRPLMSVSRETDQRRAPDAQAGRYVKGFAHLGKPPVGIVVHPQEIEHPLEFVPRKISLRTQCEAGLAGRSHLENLTDVSSGLGNIALLAQFRQSLIRTGQVKPVLAALDTATLNDTERLRREIYFYFGGAQAKKADAERLKANDWLRQRSLAYLDQHKAKMCGNH